MFIVNEQKQLSLKSLLELLPPGAYVDSAWLAAQGVLRSSLANYTKAGSSPLLACGPCKRSAERDGT